MLHNFSFVGNLYLSKAHELFPLAADGCMFSPALLTQPFVGACDVDLNAFELSQRRR